MALLPMLATVSVVVAFPQNLKLLGFTHPSTCAVELPLPT